MYEYDDYEDYDLPSYEEFSYEITNLDVLKEIKDGWNKLKICLKKYPELEELVNEFDKLLNYYY